MKFFPFVLLFSLSYPAFTAELQVLSSIKPLTLIVESYVGGLVDSGTLLAVEESPHHMSLRVSQLKKLQSADLVIWIGPDLEPFLEKPLQPKNTVCFSCLPGLVLLETNDSSHGHVLDPHLWLDLDNVAILIKALNQELQKHLPHQQQYLREREVAFLEELKALKAKSAEKVKGKDKSFLSYHNALGYFVSAYKLQGIEALMEGSEAGISAAHLAHLRKQAENFNCMIADIQEQPSASVYAKQLKLPLVIIDLMAANKTSWWEYYEALSDAINDCSKLDKG